MLQPVHEIKIVTMESEKQQEDIVLTMQEVHLYRSKNAWKPIPLRVDVEQEEVRSVLIHKILQNNFII